MTSNPQAGVPADHRLHTTYPLTPRTRVCWLTVSVLGAAFLGGLAEGAVSYSRRAPVAERHVAGTNAITIEIALAIAASVVVLTIQLLRLRDRGRRGPSPWIAPFSSAAMARLRRTFRLSPGAVAVRAVPSALLIAVMLYAPFRMGAQIIGGIDPNFTVNAWGGPSYTGALLAHWLDCLIGFYVLAFLLSRLLAPGRVSDRPARPRPGGSGGGSPRIRPPR